MELYTINKKQGFVYKIKKKKIMDIDIEKPF